MEISLSITILILVLLLVAAAWFYGALHPYRAKPVLLVVSRAASSLGVKVYVASFKPSWDKGVLTITLSIQRPNPCTDVDLRHIVAEKTRGVEAKIILAVMHPGAACIQVLPPPENYTLSLPLNTTTGYLIEVYVTFIASPQTPTHVPRSRLVFRGVVVVEDNKPSIGNILEDPKAYEGSVVTLRAVYTGWQPPENTKAPLLRGPPVTRSDWTIADKTGWIYMAANSPAKPGLDPTRDWGTPLIVVGRVKTVKAGNIVSPYIVAQRILLRQ